MSESASFWAFLKRHKVAFVVFIVAAIVAAAWAVYVFWWFTGNAQSTNLVPSALGSWTMGNLVSFIIYSILWELLLVGVPLAVAAIGAWLWWRGLPYEERMGYHWGKGSRRTGGSGGVSGVLFIAFAIKVYVDGNWNLPFDAYTLNYVVGSMITILAWVAVIIGIPVAIGLTWWASRKMKTA